MRIGIDARMLGPNVGGGGLGRYVEELVRELTQLDHKNRFILFLKEEGQRVSKASRASTASKIEERYTPVHWYTLKEQLVMPRLIDREHLDLVHFPYWNVPLFMRTPFVVTIHDLILLDEPRSAKATTRHPLVFALKRLGYRLVLRCALKRARAIIAVSQYTKSRILHYFPWIPNEKIHVVYEGLTNIGNTLKIDEMRRAGGVKRSSRSIATVRSLNTEAQADRDFESISSSLLYIGNAYPHKNLDTLLIAFEKLRERHPTLSLTLAGRRDVFYDRLQTRAKKMGLESAVHFVLNPTDTQLAALLREATLYVFPSRNEGFGLPPLEAMSVGLPVVASRAGSLPEILGDAAVWFDPNEVEDMVGVIHTALTDQRLRERLVQKGFERVTRYSWATMAREVIEIYERNATKVAVKIS